MATATERRKKSKDKPKKLRHQKKDDTDVIIEVDMHHILWNNRHSDNMTPLLLERKFNLLMEEKEQNYRLDLVTMDTALSYFKRCGIIDMIGSGDEKSIVFLNKDLSKRESLIRYQTLKRTRVNEKKDGYQKREHFNEEQNDGE